MTRILVIGGTGRVGREVLAQLPYRDVHVRALVRNPETAALPPCVDLVQGDLTVPQSLEKCVEGVDAVFLVWCAPPDAVGPALERIVGSKNKGSKNGGRTDRIVFLSSPFKTAHPLFQGAQPNALSALHRKIERLIETSGSAWTFLRPGMFAANARYWWAPQIRNGGDVVRWPYLAVPTAPIDERDIAAVAVRALCEPGHAEAEYVLTGPQSLSQFEQITTIANAIERSLRIEELSPEQARCDLLALLPASITDMLLDAWAAAMGQPALVTSTVAKITGTSARTFGEWVRDHTAEFRP